MSQFYRVYHPGTEVEAPKLADIEADGGLVIAAQPAVAFMIGWTLEQVLKKLVQYDFKFVVRRGAARTSDFVTSAPSTAARAAAREAVQVRPKPAKAAKTVRSATKPVKKASSALNDLTTSVRPEALKPRSMRDLPKTTVVMGKKI